MATARAVEKAPQADEVLEITWPMPRRPRAKKPVSERVPTATISQRYRVARRIKIDAMLGDLAQADTTIDRLAREVKDLTGGAKGGVRGGYQAAVKSVMKAAVRLCETVEGAAVLVAKELRAVDEQGRREPPNSKLRAKYATRRRKAQAVAAALDTAREAPQALRQRVAALVLEGTPEVVEAGVSEIHDIVAEARTVLGVLIAGVDAEGKLHAVAKVDHSGKHVPVEAVKLNRPKPKQDGTAAKRFRANRQAALDGMLSDMQALLETTNRLTIEGALVLPRAADEPEAVIELQRIVREVSEQVAAAAEIVTKNVQVPGPDRWAGRDDLPKALRNTAAYRQRLAETVTAVLAVAEKAPKTLAAEIVKAEKRVSGGKQVQAIKIYADIIGETAAIFKEFLDGIKAHGHLRGLAVRRA